MFYELLETAEEFPKTSQPSPESFLTVFNEAKEVYVEYMNTEITLGMVLD